MTCNKLILAFAVLLVAFMLWPLRSGELWIIDDHIIVEQAYQYDSLKPASFLSRYTTLLLQTETGHPGKAIRYRPIYWAEYTLKSGLAGDNAKAWFIFNAAYCLLGITAFGLALGRFFPWYVTLPFMALTMALPLHRDLWPRLGPSEISAFTYFMFFCLAASRLREKCLWAWPCCNIAVALAIGYKENFLLLLFPLGMLAIYGLKQKYLQPWRLCWLAFPILVAIPVARVIMRTISKTRNIYMHDTSVLSLLNKIVLFFTSSGFLICATCLAALLFLYFITHKQSRSIFSERVLPVPLKPQALHCSLVVFLAMTVLVAGNYVFYSGRISFYGRYAFPYYFLLAGFGLCLLYPLMENVGNRYASSGKFRSRVTILGIALIVALSPFIYINMSRIKRHIQLTMDFQNTLQEAKGYREIFLINPGELGLSAEPYFSLKKYNQAGYLPSISYFPLFVKHESAGELSKNLDNLLSSVVSRQPPLTLVPDVLLWQALGAAPLKKIEHTRDSRDIKELLTASHLPSISDGLALISSPVVFYIPVDDPAITGMTLTGSSDNNYTAWRISVNDHVIVKENLSYDEKLFTIKLPVMEPDDFPHPQLYKLSFEPDRADATPLHLHSISLLRFDLKTGDS